MTPTPKRPAHRPPLDPADRAGVTVKVYLTTAQLALLDEARGTMSRSQYLAERAGLR